LASFRLNHRVFQTCSFAKASPKTETLAPHRYIISVNALTGANFTPQRLLQAGVSLADDHHPFR
jgi:hypothetical protein